MFLFLLTIGLLISSIIYLFWTSNPPSVDQLKGQHILITGGSSGIGKSLAHQVIKRGANVTLFARNVDKLNSAKVELESNFVDNRQTVRIYSVDVTLTKEVEHAVRESIEAIGPVDMLVNCAGTSMSRKMEDTLFDEYKRMMEVNYFGTVMMTKAVIPKMKENKDGGKVVFVSSQAGLLGLYGYSAYSASKFALRGFAEALAMEVKPYGISITVNCPPDTDTPGFAEENKDKPEETRLISESAGLFQPNEVAKSIIEDTLNGTFLSSIGMDGWILTTVTAGMSRCSPLILLTQIALMGPLRLIGWGYLQYFDWIVKKCQIDREKKK